MNDIPFYFQSRGDECRKIALRLTTAPHRCLVRIFGGCGNMQEVDANGMMELFDQAFIGFQGALLYGGSRMVLRHDVQRILPSINEVVPLIRRKNPMALAVGIIPRTEDLALRPDFGMILSDSAKNNYVSIVHPEQSSCLFIQDSSDRAVSWEVEYQETAKIADELRTYGNWRSVHIAYNGGELSEQELLLAARNGWPVVLIQGSGRVTDAYASNRSFLDNDHVHVVDKHPGALRAKLVELGALTSTFA